MSADDTYTVTPRILLGLALTLLGISGLGLVNLGIWILLWPLALLLGGTHLLARILIGIIEWSLSVALSPFGVARALPLVLMLWGGAIIWSALARGRHRDSRDREQAHVS